MFIKHIAHYLVIDKIAMFCFGGHVKPSVTFMTAVFRNVNALK